MGNFLQALSANLRGTVPKGLGDPGGFRISETIPEMMAMLAIAFVLVMVGYAARGVDNEQRVKNQIINDLAQKRITCKIQ